LQDALDLPDAPLRIECFDVSNIQGTNVVASMVVFEDGLPRKSEYRRFAIRGVAGQDDVASMYETISRRFSRYLAERVRTGVLDALRGRDASAPPASASPRPGTPAFPPASLGGDLGSLRGREASAPPDSASPRPGTPAFPPASLGGDLGSLR